MHRLMKKYSILLITSFILITTSCVTKPKKTNEIILPPEPTREELDDVHSVKDMAERIAYYDGLVTEWELWAEKVKKIVAQ